MDEVPIINDLRDIFVEFVFGIIDAFVNVLLTSLPDLLPALLSALEQLFQAPAG